MKLSAVSASRSLIGCSTNGRNDLDNFIVRPQRRFVEKFQAGMLAAARTRRTAELPSISRASKRLRDDDLAAKQFDYLSCRLSWRCYVAIRPRQPTARIMASPPGWRNYPTFHGRAEMALILEVRPTNSGKH